MTTNNRPTPETDAAERLYADRQHHYAVRDLARKLERERDDARDKLLKLRLVSQELRELARELRDALASFEYEGNEKGTRCISCGAHCSHPHMRSCEVSAVLTKAKEVLP